MNRIQTSADAWLGIPAPNPTASVRLLCLPHAGAGASAFRGWPHAFSRGVEVAVARFPGREGRYSEPLVHSMASLVDHLADAIAALTPLPFTLFGHSMGARVAFELARACRRRSQPQPARLYVSAARAPHLPHPNQIHNLPDDEFLSRLRELGGIPAEVLAAPELLAVLIPIVRADFTALETCVYAAEPPLSCAISAFSALDDPLVPAGAVDAWRTQTTAEFTLHTLDGGHFFLQAKRSRLISIIDDDMTAIPSFRGGRLEVS